MGLPASEARGLLNMEPSPPNTATVADTPSREKEAIRLPAPSPVAEANGAGWDIIRGGLVLLLAFFLASFPASNSDAWRHLAAGRAFVDGTYHFGTDPFCYTTEGHYWTNPSWFADLLAYGLYQAGDGVGLVVVKALLLAILALLMLRSCRQKQSRWIAALSVGLALVGMGPYLALRPVCLSYLLLGFTVWRLERPPRSEPGDTRPAWRRALAAHWPLLVGFALWANLDEWFLLGPLTVGLYALGAALESHSRPAGPCRATELALVTLAGLAVGLLNPHHVHVFNLPALLDPRLSAELLAETFGTGQVLSPFAPRLWRAGLSPAAGAYYLLLLAGLLSFLVNLGRWRWPHVLVWLAFGLLSVYRGAAIPFFAIVAGPITAANFQDYLAQRRAAARPLSRRARWSGQLATVLLLLAAVLAAWTGWLQGFAPGPRSWALGMNPSLKDAAHRLRDWRDKGKLPATGHGFTPSLATADCLAWLCPQEKSFLDSRPRAFPDKGTQDFLVLRRALVPSPFAKRKHEAEADWRTFLRDHAVTHLIVFDPNDNRLIAALGTALAAPAEWRLIGLDGKAAVLSWRRASRPLILPAVDLKQLAYRPSEAARAPRRGPERLPESRTWYDAFWKPQPTTTEDSDAALAYLVYFDARGPATVIASRSRCVKDLAASVVGLAASETGRLGLGPTLDLRLALMQAVLSRPAEEERARWGNVPGQFWYYYDASRDQGPPAALYLAVRAARRAIAAQPDDPVAHLHLGQAYFRLLRSTRERAAAVPRSALKRVRQVQAITALATAVRLRPDYAEAHALLHGVYLDLGYLDLALHHLREYLKYNRAAGSAEEALRRQQEEKAEKLEKVVRERQHEAETAGFSREVVDRAGAARDRGLPGRALEILLNADSVSRGRSGTLEAFQLLLLAGRAPEVRAWLDLQKDAELANLPALRWLRAELAAAEGNYKQADQELGAFTLHGLDMPELKQHNVPFRVGMALLIGNYLLERAAPRRLSPYEIDQTTFLNQVLQLDQTIRGQVDLLALRGLLALEAGYVNQARELFTQAVSSWGHTEGEAFARHYLELLTPENIPVRKGPH
jgi:hypothetical protein